VGMQCSGGERDAAAAAAVACQQLDVLCAVQLSSMVVGVATFVQGVCLPWVVLW
jgi:hypothetical protein